MELCRDYKLSRYVIERHAQRCVPKSLTRAAQRRREEVEDNLLRHAIAHKAERLAKLQDLASRLTRLIEARGKWMRENVPDVPGADTGLLTREVRGIGQGANFQVIEEYRLDARLVSELRSTLEAAAREMGQFGEAPQAGSRERTALIVLPSPAAGQLPEGVQAVTLDIGPLARARLAPIPAPGAEVEAEAEDDAAQQ